MNSELEKILNFENPEPGPECDVAVSSRVRLARNLGDFPFPGRLNRAGRKKVIDAVNAAANAAGKYSFIDFSPLSADEAGALMERRAVSLDFVKSPEEKELVADAENGLYVMVNEEDHLRIQSIKPGFAIYEAYGEAGRFDDLANEGLDYAYDEDFGYLTQCPTNLGTGMRVSVMLHLPALTMSRKIQKIMADLPKVGATMRGFYGEGTEVGGDLYQISNNITLGISEEQTLDKIKPVADRIIELERAGRSELLKRSGDMMADKIKRAYGTMKNAHMVSSSEFLSLYSMVRLGISCDIIKNAGYGTMDALLAKAMPSSLSLHFAGSEANRDILRAGYIQSKI
ncbi:MAG: ATP--guanido phosphotransferase [Oscillospiraceae bacterium]|nr:ATP--guanido phosphotransferase [Oscillospiraceae bacterium]